MVETEEDYWADEGRFWYSQEANDIGRWQEENCRSPKAEVVKGESSEGRLEQNPYSVLVEARPPTSEGGFLCMERLLGR